MRRSLSIHEAAELEINEAADFYDLESPGLGNAFLDEIQKAIGQILLFPESAPEKGKIKTFNLSRFPYSLMYAIRPVEIRLLAVAHQRRRPFYWRNRS